MSSSYNELKLEVLEEADNWDEFTVGDMAKALGRTHCSIAMAVLRYHRHGLLSRYTTNRKNEKVYALTDRGLERLDWLMEQDSDDDGMSDYEEVDDEEENEESGTGQDDDDFLKDYESLSLKKKYANLKKIMNY